MPIGAGRLVLLLCALLLPAVLGAQDKAAGIDEKIKEGDALLLRRQWEEALKSYKAANNLAEKRSAPAHIGMARAYQGMLAYKSAADSCTEALKFAAGDKILEAGARNLRGMSLFALSEKADDKRLKQAEEDFRAVLTLTDAMTIARYNLGVALLKQGRDEEGIAELRAYVETAGRAPEIASAKAFIENPRRARENYAPDFSIVTLEGEHLALEDLKGKVVLIDFWATWCGPCVEATPRLARLLKSFKDRPFLIVGISADREDGPWKAFIADHKLSWPQYRDGRGQLSAKFRVSGFPTYMLVDHEGIVRYQKLGWNPSVDNEIESEARKLLKRAAAGNQQ